MIRRLHLVTPSLNTSKKLVILVTLIQLRLDRTADEKQTDDTEFSKSPRPLSSVRGRKSSKKLCSPRFAAQRRAKEQQQQQQQQQWPLSLHPDETSSSSQPVRSTGLLSSRRGQATAERQTWSRSRLPKPFCGQIGVNPNSEGPSAQRGLVQAVHGLSRPQRPQGRLLHIQGSRDLHVDRLQGVRLQGVVQAM